MAVADEGALEKDNDATANEDDETAAATKGGEDEEGKENTTPVLFSRGHSMLNALFVSKSLRFVHEVGGGRVHGAQTGTHSFVDCGGVRLEEDMMLANPSTPLPRKAWAPTRDVATPIATSERTEDWTSSP
ncbi:Aste57867_15089 [Aphanomyces stellatus]|uniref:Aste57867_15089 protein n=1 Tax=Aphanomyces stellatus TaxID=120398 RepID=A0A485L2D3_9STRA|nr:hypothetical protein As57867_015033 [Aphanomyces stellatus]VFT91902.1 Aste57867_15089 [Aphanomyces stellatus]